VGVPAPVLAPIISEAVNVTYLVGRDAAVGDQSLQVLGGCPVNIQLDRHFTIFIHLSLARTGIELTDSGTPLTSALYIYKDSPVEITKPSSTYTFTQTLLV
jgi:hypothetical protein